MRLLLLLPLLCLPACTNLRAQRCDALQDEVDAASAPCTECLARLTAGGDAGLCQYACAHGPAVSAEAVKVCTPEAPATTPPQTAEVTQ